MIPAHEEALKRLLGEPVEEPESIVIELDIPEFVPPQFYVHINIRNQIITAITQQSLPVVENAEVVSVEIPYELAEKFLLGSESVLEWVVVHQDGKYGIIKSEEINKDKISRIETNRIVEVTQDVAYPDVRIVIGNKQRIAIHYNGEKIEKWPHPVRLYFTGEDDPSDLKCTFSLSINTLSKIVNANKLTEWPNPIYLSLPNSDDISVFTIKSDLKIAISRNEAGDN